MRTSHATPVSSPPVRRSIKARDTRDIAHIQRGRLVYPRHQEPLSKGDVIPPPQWPVASTSCALVRKPVVVRVPTISGMTTSCDLFIYSVKGDPESLGVISRARGAKGRGRSTSASAIGLRKILNVPRASRSDVELMGCAQDALGLSCSSQDSLEVSAKSRLSQPRLTSVS